MRNKLFFGIIISLLLFGCNYGISREENRKIKISVWAMGEEANRLGNMKQKFEAENPQIEVKIQAIPWSVVQTKLLTAITGGNPPDIAQIGSSLMGEYQRVGAFLDMTPLVEEGKISKEGFIPSTLESCEFDGKLYGVPWYSETRMLFYRKDLFSRVGYDKFPETWESFKDATLKLKAEGVKTPFTLPASEPNTPTELYSTIWQNGTEVISESGEILVETPEFKESIKYYTDFFRENISQTSIGGDLIQLFVKGEVASFIGGPWMIGIIKSGTKDFEDKWDVAMLPGKKAQTSYVGGSNFVVFSHSKEEKRESAFKFIQFMSRPDIQVEWFKNTNNLPSVREAWKSEAIQENPLVSKFEDQLEESKTVKNIPGISRIDRALVAKVEKIIYGKVDIDTGMAELKSEITKILADQ